MLQRVEKGKDRLALAVQQQHQKVALLRPGERLAHGKQFVLGLPHGLGLDTQTGQFVQDQPRHLARRPAPQHRGHFLDHHPVRAALPKGLHQLADVLVAPVPGLPDQDQAALGGEALSHLKKRR